MLKKIFSIILALLLVFSSFAATCSTAAESLATCSAEATDSFDFAVKSAELVKADEDSMLRIIGKLRREAAAFSFPYATDSVLSENGMFVLSFENEADLLACLEMLANNPAVLFAERDVPVYTEAFEESDADLCWGPEAIETDIYAESITPLRTVTVAVVDSGAANIDYLKDYLVDGYDFFDNDTDATNDTSVDSHGTFLASIVADCADNLPIRIMPVRVLDSKTGSLINVINGINYAVDNGADVINLSMCNPLVNCKALENAVAYAESKNVTFVTCAGNAKADTVSFCPSHCETAITASAVDSQYNFCEKFSNYGEEVFLAAPGEGIIGYNANGEQVVLNGTSMSAAYVSAAAAMFLVANPYCNPNQVRAALKACAFDLGNEGKDVYFGWGIPKLSNIATDIIHVGGISFSADTYTLKKGETLTIEPVFFPADATNKGCALTADSDIVEINGKMITAVKAGTANLTLRSYDGSYTATAKITVVLPEIGIKNNTGVKTINFGETLRLTAETKNVPDGTKILWYVNGEEKGSGATFELSPESGVVVAAKLADSNGKILTDDNGEEISDSQTVNVKNGFWQKLVSFFKNLFGISRLVVQSIKYV